MKKTKILVLGAMIALGVSAKAHAFPADKKVLIIGNRAYDLYANDQMIISTRFSDNEFLNYIANNSNNIYYVESNSDGNAVIQDVFGGQVITEAALISRAGGRITYYTGSETTPKDYWVSENNQYKDSVQQGGTDPLKNQYVTFQIDPKPIIGSLYIFNFKVNELVGVPGAAYFTVGTSNTAKITDAASCIMDVTTIANGAGIPVYVYASDMKTKIADAMIKQSDISDVNGNVITQSTNKTIKFNTVTNPILPIQSRYTVLGNISNGGLLDSDSSYIYYINTGDGNKIYKKNTFGTENFPISNDNSGYISVYGDWVYYCNYSDGGKIYKVRIDGTGRQKVSENKGTYLNLMDDKLYYVNASDRGKIYSIDSAGNEAKLSDDEAAFLNIGSNGNLFYSNNSEGRNLYRIDPYGNRTKVDDLGKSNSAMYVNVSINSTVAYYSSSDGSVYRSGDPYNPLKIRIQTKDGLVDDRVANINISNNTIYYKSLVDGGKLYKVGTNGGVAQKISDDTVDGIFVYSYNGYGRDDVYYTKGGKLFFIPADGVMSGSVQKGTVVGKPKVTDKVSKIDLIPIIYTNNNDSGKTIDQINVLGYLPEKVSAIMVDGSIRQLPVSWDLINVKNKNGIYTYSGTVVGFGTKVTADLALGTQTNMGINNTFASNELGNNDTITVQAGTLTRGDLVKVYDPKNPSKLLKSVAADATGGVVIGGLNFGLNPGTVKVTVTKTGKAESQPIYISFGPERGTPPIIGGSNLEKTTLTLSNDGNTITVDGLQLTLNGDEQLYIGTRADITQANNDADTNWVNVTNPGTYGSWDSTTKTLTINGVKASTSDLQFSGNGKKLLIRKAGSPASAPTAFVINPRIPAPYGVVFDETFGLIRGTSSRQQYSLDGGITWKDCSDTSTYIGTFPDVPVKVRVKATKSTLASLETLQVKVTDIIGNNQNVAITQSAAVDPTTGIVTNGVANVDLSGNVTGSTLNTIVLKSSVPVTWKVVDERGQTTNIASIVSLGKDNKTGVLTGYENGIVKVIATSIDGNNLQGELRVNITNQPVITVKNTVELNNAVSSGARVIKLLGIGGSYYLDTLPAPNNASNDLTIIGQDQTSVINVTNTTGGAFANVNGYNLNLKNLTIKGSTNSNISNVIALNSGSVNIDGVYFDSIKSNNGNTVAIAHTGGTLRVNNSRFLASNFFVKAITTTDGTITNNYFVSNINFAGENGAINVSGAAKIQGNNITGYNKNNEYAINIANGVQGTPSIGGVGKDLWNVINNCNVGINLNGNIIENLMTNNSIDIRNTTTPIKP